MNTRTTPLLVALALASGCGPADEAGPPEPPTPAAIGAEVAVTGGVVRGIVGEDGLKQYHGIPYAVPPIGELRWAPPGPVEPWPGVRNADSPGPGCFQQGAQGGFYDAATAVASMDEDCLSLNVWTRASQVDEGLPVMVWIHGGGLTVGSGDAYPGELLTSKGVVLVTINYRLGPFGFLALPELTAESESGVSGNQGFRDQIASLEWVQGNIASFGGDPNNVTIFGESAGSMSVSLLQASPLAKGLFHRVIGQSGSALGPMAFRARSTPYANAGETIGTDFAQALAGDGGDTSLHALRAIPADRILDTFLTNPGFGSALAIVDGEVLPDEIGVIFTAGEQADVPVLIGSNADEGSALFSYIGPAFGEGAAGRAAYIQATLAEVADDIDEHYPAGDDDAQATESWLALYTDASFTYPMRAWAKGMATVPSDAYLYWFTWAPPIPERERYGAFHASEIGYVFGNLGLFDAVPAVDDRALSELMATMWTNFARTGVPDGEGLPAWPAYTSENEVYMEFGVDRGAKSGLRTAKMELFERAWALRRENAQQAADSSNGSLPDGSDH
ncbi:MAG: carboxylesterase family protein [Gammaproteobacteria bacterium]|nr:carboxylesterase family protein [Gammaproteobacteria bacterium]MDE0190687.1 carboxylesterase family protein [Gammaproteobacteria bacterium]